MSTVTSCTFLSGCPAVSSSGGRLSKKPAAVVSLKSRPLSLCFANGPKTGEYNPKIDLPAFSIPPIVLVNPVSVAGERWHVEEKSDSVSLLFDVPGLSREDLAVEIDEDVLVIRRKKATLKSSNTTTATYPDKPAVGADVVGGSGIFARLLLPAGYSRERVEAKLSSGELTVTIAKVKESARRKINVDISVN
ncbi:hypothetical protein E2562_032289 [Oryza meyeriana var. granulata]|uniref:SHSP domain-containing protein n=1 Tax=Oryza meyeriana var. granulata TaxID=110450 RepID=A0A6G1F0G6_9ORYZ|nr:hypothetical protein E2562_032289 [Oryza meyeriana var. granulata]